MQHLTEVMITVHRVQDNLQHLTAVMISVHKVKDNDRWWFKGEQRQGSLTGPANNNGIKQKHTAVFHTNSHSAGYFKGTLFHRLNFFCVPEAG